MTTKANSRIKQIRLTGIIIFTLAILSAGVLLLIEPTGLDAKNLIAPLLAALLIGSLAFSYSIASKADSKTLATIGTLCLALLFTMVGLFVVAGVAWLIALSHS